MLAFTDKWGFVENGRDERGYLKSWREGLNYFGFAGRWRWFRQTILGNESLAPYFLPKTADKFGIGYLMAHADEQVTRREQAIEQAGGHFQMEQPDFLQQYVTLLEFLTHVALGPGLVELSDPRLALWRLGLMMGHR